MTPIFVDTNIFLYAAGSAPVERVKTLRARQLLTTIDVALSTQVLQEFYWIATRPHKLGLSHEEAQKLIDLWKLFRIQPITIGVVEDALALCSRYQINYWDAAIIAAARHLGCELLYSEDLNPGQRYGGILVANPFIDG